ncbi:MAG: LOG family protein [Phycisphaeraceae bacterium]|nr:LOG family protein [Phycisphaeraceae bacterium]
MPPISHPEHNRPELDPPPGASIAPPVGVPPEKPAQRRADDPDITQRIDDLIRDLGGEPGTFDARLVRDLIATGLKLIPDGRDTGELKLITTAVKELRYAYRVFGQYPEPHKVTIFGSARTPPDHPDYLATVQFSRLMADAGWMVITGAGGGIMEAGHVGPGREKSFGVAIRLPFETTANEVIAKDEKLIHFRYFFTRKLMFLSQAEAVALFPGGFGTMDEAYEALTLIQTGKSSMIPVVLLEGRGQNYWEQWDGWVKSCLLERKLISPEDIGLYRIFSEPEQAVDHIKRFYRIYHSSRYVQDDLVIRLKKPIRPADIERLSREFASLIKRGTMVLRGPYEVEDDHLDLPRLAFTHTRSKFGMVRKLIDAINECEPQ